MNWEEVDILIEFLTNQLATMKGNEDLKTVTDVYLYLEQILDYLKGLKEGNAT